MAKHGSNKWVFLFGTALVFSAGFAACGSDNESAGGRDAGAVVDGVDPNAFELFFEPSEATLVLDGTGPKTATFVLKATSNGVTREVVPESFSFDRPDLAKLGTGAPLKLTADGAYAGTGTLKGTYLGKEATAKLHVTVTAEEIGPGVDNAAINALRGSPLPPDPSFSTLLYPYDQTVFPLGLEAPLLQWNAPAAADVYRVHLEQSNYKYDGYFVVNQPGRQRITQIIWDRMTVSTEGDPLRLELSRYDVATQTAYSSAKQAWPIARANLRGAIYYWTTSAGGHMSSIRPGTGAAPNVLNGGKCMGCHAVSADGTTLVASIEDATPARAWQSFSLPNVTPGVQSTTFSGNLALNPDGRFVVYGAPKLELGNTQTGAAIPNSGLEALTLLPENDALGQPAFAPGGRLLAYTEAKKTGGWHNPQGDFMRLLAVDFDPLTQKFSNQRSLAQASQFPANEKALAYPSFAPDSQWVAFHVGDRPTGCEDSCDDNEERTGRIWFVNATGGGLVRLDKLNDSSLNPADHDRTFEPTFNPIERGGYHWVVVTSARDYGNTITGTPNNKKKRLWVAAIDKTPGAGDPSHPAFYLDGQEGDTTNMRGFWTLAQCTPSAADNGGQTDASACGAGYECCSGFCDKGICVDVGSLQCVHNGGACTQDTECCNYPSVRCVNGTCKNEGPK